MEKNIFLENDKERSFHELAFFDVQDFVISYFFDERKLFVSFFMCSLRNVLSNLKIFTSTQKKSVPVNSDLFYNLPVTNFSVKPNAFQFFAILSKVLLRQSHSVLKFWIFMISLANYNEIANGMKNDINGWWRFERQSPRTDREKFYVWRCRNHWNIMYKF